MPISIKRDVKPAFQFGSNFSLRKTPIFRNTGETVFFSGGSYLDAIRPQIADRNWTQFYNSWNAGSPDDVQRSLTRAIASKFNLQGREDIYNELFTFANHARLYEKNQRESIEHRLADSYLFAARLAAGIDVNEPCFRRATDTQATNIVVFSDLHMTAQPHLPSYFKNYNYQLYLDVLDYYAASRFTLVENGDVEDCLVYDPTLEGAKERSRAAPKVTTPPGWQGGMYFDPESHLPAGHFDLPIRTSDPRWREFLLKRYDKRERNQQDIFDAFQEYYEKIVKLFARDGRYFRLTGNHDTYLDGEFEFTLKTRIEEALGSPVYDALRVNRGSTTHPVTKYLIMHGHQFDSVCLQAGNTPYAKSLGEIYSECVSWAFQGAERVWTLDDTKKWYYCSKGISNVLAREAPGTYLGGGSGEWDLLWDNLDRIKKQPRDFIETLLGHEVGWEYFENANGFEAFTLEVWTGDEAYKLRSLNEVELCLRYTNSFLDINPPQQGVPIPKLIIGHTHEPRQNAVFPVDPDEHEPWERTDNNAGVYYINSGSAGRFEKLIWCVEITGDVDRIVSWSNIDGKLTRIAWRSDGGRLVHDV